MSKTIVLHIFLSAYHTKSMRNLFKLTSTLFFFPIFFAVSCHRTAPSRNSALQENARQEQSISIHELNQEDWQDDLFDPLLTPTPSVGVWDTHSVDLSQVRQDKKLIALTFDDAPGKTLERILAVFSSYNERNPDCPAFATLFCNGNRIRNESTPLLHAALALGWELGNHTFSHPDLTKLSNADIMREIQTTDKLLYAVDQKDVHLFRAPFGKINQTVKAQLQTPAINWTIDTLDWTGRSAEEIYQTVFKEKFSGAIVLMHDGYEGTMSALKRLLPDLKEAGYQAVTLSALIKAHGKVFKNGVEYVRAIPQTLPKNGDN